MLVAFLSTYALGFERNLRGSSAGDRTFSLIGVGAALVAILALRGAPNAPAGVVTGIGFLGAALTFRPSQGGRRSRPRCDHRGSGLRSGRHRSRRGSGQDRTGRP
ncbi:MgtC/SapB family protein [Streptomyces sp. JNUCC 63]